MSNKKLSDDVLKRWYEEGLWAGDFHNHFESTNLILWMDIANEAERMWNVMFQVELEEDSTFPGLFDGIAAQAAYGAIVGVARMLGVNPEELNWAVGNWNGFERKDIPDPLQFPELQAKIHQIYCDMGGQRNYAAHKVEGTEP